METFVGTDVQISPICISSFKAWLANHAIKDITTDMRLDVSFRADADQSMPPPSSFFCAETPSVGLIQAVTEDVARRSPSPKVRDGGSVGRWLPSSRVSTLIRLCLLRIF